MIELQKLKLVQLQFLAGLENFVPITSLGDFRLVLYHKIPVISTSLVQLRKGFLVSKRKIFVEATRKHYYSQCSAASCKQLL